MFLVIFDGSDPQQFTWTSQGNGIWSTTINVGNTHLVVANNERLFEYKSLDDLTNQV